MFARSFVLARNLERGAVTGSRIWGHPLPHSNPFGVGTGWKYVRPNRKGLSLLNYYEPVISDMGPPVVSVRDRKGEIKSTKRIPLRIEHMGEIWKTDQQIYQKKKIEWYKENKNKYPTKKFSGVRQKKKSKR